MRLLDSWKLIKCLEFCIKIQLLQTVYNIRTTYLELQWITIVHLKVAHPLSTPFLVNYQAWNLNLQSRLCCPEACHQSFIDLEITHWAVTLASTIVISGTIVQHKNSVSKPMQSLPVFRTFVTVFLFVRCLENNLFRLCKVKLLSTSRLFGLFEHRFR